jgi:hypothetical protein
LRAKALPRWLPDQAVVAPDVQLEGVGVVGGWAIGVRQQREAIVAL